MRVDICVRCGTSDNVGAHCVTREPVCSHCNFTEDFYTICKIDAKKNYKLNDEHLTPLRHALKTNPHYGKAAPMHLYLRKDIVALSSEVENKRVEAKRLVEENSRTKAMEKLIAKGFDPNDQRWIDIPNHLKQLAIDGYLDAKPSCTMTKAWAKLQAVYCVYHGCGSSSESLLGYFQRHPRLSELFSSLYSPKSSTESTKKRKASSVTAEKECQQIAKKAVLFSRNVAERAIFALRMHIRPFLASSGLRF